MAKRIKLLIVDHSALMRQLLVQIFQSDPDIHVVGTASDALSARAKIKDLSPDVLTLDTELPGMDGLQFLEKLMRSRPMPVVMVSSMTKKDSDATLRALSLGAVDYITKPTINALSEILQHAEAIVSRVKDAANARVHPHFIPSVRTPEKAPGKYLHSKVRAVVAIGSSTGGTEALRELLVSLPADFPGIVIVQHMSPAFTKPFASRLDSVCSMQVKQAQDGDLIMQGQVLVAPGGYQMEVHSQGMGFCVKVYEGERVNLHRPSVDVLFRSCATALGRNAYGVILTGMGADGARGMLEMKQANGHTIAQDEATCVVFGMPKEAIRLGGVDQVLPLDQIGQALLQMFRN